MLVLFLSTGVAGPLLLTHEVVKEAIVNEANFFRLLPVLELFVLFRWLLEVLMMGILQEIEVIVV